MLSFQDLTPKLLRKIFDYLSFAEISKLRGVSTNLHQAARQRLNSTFLELGPRLMTKYTQYLILVKTNDTSSNSGDCIFRGRFLRLLGSEHAILLALCRNYITNGKGCFFPGEILDLFHDLQGNIFPTGMQHEEENKKLARLLLLIDQYVDWFERFWMSSENESSWYGTYVVDLLDAYLSSSYNLVATHDGPLVKLSGRYVMKGQSEIPPKISEPLGGPISQKELLQILQYIRKHVRWFNFIKSFRNDSEKTGESEDNEEIITSNNGEGYRKIYKRNQSDICDYDENTESLIVMVNLQCDRSEGPARIRGGFEEMSEWRKEIEFFKREMKDSQPCMEKNLSRVSKNGSANKFTKSKKAQLKTLKEFTGIDTSKRPLHEKYTFNLEIKSIYPSITATSGEKFCETMIHVSHTPEHTFAAQTECSLYSSA